MAQVHQHHASCDQADADQLRRTEQLAVGKATHQHDGDGADATPEGIGEAERDRQHHLGQESHRDGVSEKHQHGGQWFGHSLRQAQAGGAEHFSGDGQKQQGPR